jgi:TatD DNase family protein
LDTFAPQPSPNHSLIDIGTNLTHKSFHSDYKEVITRAQQAGVEKIIITGTSVKESQKAAELAEDHPQILYSTAGVHPHDAKDYTPASHDDLYQLAQLPQVKAIGECGLDFNRMFSTKEQQIKAFEDQIELAITLKIPLFLHERDAHREQWEMLASYRNNFSRAVIHCFTGNKQQAFKYLDLDLHIGITGWICDERRGKHLHDFIGDIPLQRLMLETDAPYLMPRVKPKPKLKSSSRNEPCTLPFVLAEVAKHSAYSTEHIAAVTTKNAIDFFALD